MNRQTLLSCTLLALIGLPLWTTETLQEKLQHLSRTFYPEAVALRHRLHRIPEPCFQERETSELVRAELEKLGLEVERGWAGTGLKAVLTGGKPGGTVALRTDLDGLPITEKTGLGWESEKEGFMHACGHDIHMTNLLVAARILSQVREEIRGKVVLIAQPCEEGTPDGSPSGAERLIEAGILQNPCVDAIIGLHVMPGLPLGTVSLKSGPLMANVGSIFITLKGRASHGALPHQGIDTIYLAAQAINQFQGLISRLRNPADPAVLTIGKIEGGVRLNVIADTVRMEGTVRSFSFETEKMIETGIGRILEGQKTAFGVSYEYTFSRMSLFVKNHPRLTEWCRQSFVELLGPERVLTAEPMTVGEDFAMYSHRIPGFFYFLGAGEEGSLHADTFAPSDEILMTGPMTLAYLAIRTLDRLAEEPLPQEQAPPGP